MSVIKLLLGPLPKASSVKLTVTLSTDLRGTLEEYAAEHSRTYGEPVDAASLIPHMLDAFMARDRAFKARRAKAAAALRCPE